MSVTLSKTSKNAPLLIHNGYAYTVDRRTDEKIYWKCEHAKKLGCRGRLHTDTNNVFLKTVGEHDNHIGNPCILPLRKYYEHLLTESQQNHINPHNILTQVNIGLLDEIRVQLPQSSSLKRNIRRWRQDENIPPAPGNLNFSDIPKKYHRTTRNRLFLRKDTGPGPDRLIILFTDEQKHIMENATDFFVDGTFKVLPEIFFQLFAIHALYRGHVVPVAIVLLTGKSGKIYNEMIREIIDLVPRWNPRSIMMDFEKATMNAFGQKFSTVELSGCFFHLSQSLLRYLQNHGFKQKYENDLTFADNIHRILALAFIEPNHVATAFEHLCSSLGDDYQQILDYIEDHYIGRIRGNSRRDPMFLIKFWNLFERVKNDLHRTNNNLEGWHRKLNCAFQSAHPTLWTFLDKLIKEENNIHSDIVNIMSGALPKKSKNESLNRKLKNLVDNPHDNLDDQLKYVGRLLSL